MRHPGVGIGLAQLVEDRLIGHLARQPHVLRRDRARRRAEQRAPPVRRRAGDERDAGGGGAREEIAHRLVGAGEHHRAAADQRAQQDLQPAIAADVVERAPHLFAAGVRRARDRAGQAAQRMDRHLRRSGGAGGEQRPFAHQPRRIGRRGHRHGHAGDDAGRRQIGHVLVGHDDARPGRRHHAGQVLRPEIGGTQHDPPRQPVQLQQCQRGRKLRAGREHDALAAHPLALRPEDRRTGQAVEPDARMFIEQEAPAERPRRRRPLPQRCLVRLGHAVRRVRRTRRTSPARRCPRRC